MKKLATVAAVFALVLGTPGCSTKTEIEGEAFLDQGSGAQKLALVSIQVVPEEQFIAHIKSQLPKAKEEATRLQDSVARATASNAEMDAIRAQGAALRAQAAAMGVGGSSIAASQAQENRSQDLDAQRAALAAQDSSSLLGLTTGANPLYFTGKFDGAILSTETNADGKFKLNLEAGKKVVLVAVKDGLTWALWVTPDKSKATLTLSNKNLSGTECDDCVFSKTVTPQSIGGI